MNYIFIDESGDLGKNSNYFIAAAIITNNPKKLVRLINRAHRNFKKQISKSNEIKGNLIPNNVIKYILKKLDDVDYEVFVIVFNKRNKCKLKFKSNNELYDIIVSQLAKLIPIDSSSTIIIDKSKSKSSEIQIFNELFENNLNNFKKYPIKFSHLSSLHNKELQIADLIAWSFFQDKEHNNDEFINIIKNKTVKDVFED